MSVLGPVWRELPEPRLPSDAETALLMALARGSGLESLVAQVTTAQVIAECRCGCSSVRFAENGPPLPAETIGQLSGQGRDDYLSVQAGIPGRQQVKVTLHVVGGLLHELELFAGDGVAVHVPAVPRLGDVSVE